MKIGDLHYINLKYLLHIRIEYPIENEFPQKLQKKISSQH